MDNNRRGVPSFLLRVASAVLFSLAFMVIVADSTRTKSEVEALVPLPTLVADVPIFDGTIYTMDLSEDGNTLYVGGSFTDIATDGGETHFERYNLAALDAHTHEVLDWNPFADGIVRALVVDGSYVYVGGSFASVGGEDRSEFAKIDGVSGEVISGCDPNVFTTPPETTVYSIDVDGGWIYIGGDFIKVGGELGTDRNGLARLDEETCELDTEWDPDPQNSLGTVFIYSIAVDGSDVYVGGDFSSIGGIAQTEFARIDAVTGDADPLCDISVNYDDYYGLNIVFPKSVYSLDFDDDFIYIGGYFYQLYDLSEGAYHQRGNIARLHKDDTCSVDEWSPVAYGFVTTIHVEGENVYVGGSFSFIAGQTGSQFAKLSSTTGIADLSWNPLITSEGGDTVYDSIFGDSALYVGGDITEALEEQRFGFAAFSLDATPPEISLTPLVPDPTTDATPSFSGSAEDDHGTVAQVEYQIDSTSGDWNLCSLDSPSSSPIIESFEGSFPPEGWTLGGGMWEVDEGTYIDGDHSAVSGNVGCSEGETYYSEMRAELSLTEPSVLSYYWRSYADESNDADLFFCHDVDECSYDNKDYIITGNTNWKGETLLLEAGTHSLSWIHKVISCPSGLLDVSSIAGWVDAISITPVPLSTPSFVCDVDPALADGTHIIYVRATDSNGNTTAIGSYATDEFTIDATPPAFPVQEVDTDTSVVPGKIVTVQTQRPTFGGVTEPFSHIMLTIYTDPVIVGETDADEDGQWEWTPDEDIPAGTYRVEVLTQDQVGNEVLGEFTLIIGLAETGEGVMPLFIVASEVLVRYFIWRRKGVLFHRMSSAGKQDNYSFDGDA